MNLLIGRDAALAAVNKVRGIVPGRSAIPILTHLRLTAGEGVLSLTACDLDMEATAQAGADIEAPGDITVAADRFGEALRSLPSGSQVSMKLGESGNRLIVQCGRSRFQMPTLYAAEFPSLEGRAGARISATMTAPDLARLLGATAFAMSSEATRYYLCGAHLCVQIVDGVHFITTIATDGIALGRAIAPCPEGWRDAPGIIIPRKAIGEVRRLLDGISGDVEFWTNQRLFGLQIGDTRFAAKLVDGAYPDWSRVIPRDLKHVAEVGATDFAAAIKRCEIMAGNIKAKVLRMEIGPGVLMVSARDGEGGEASEALEIEYDGPARDLLFNPKYLGEIVAQIRTERLTFRFGGPNDAVTIEEPRTSDALYVLMPLRF